MRIFISLPNEKKKCLVQLWMDETPTECISVLLILSLHMLCRFKPCTYLLFNVLPFYLYHGHHNPTGKFFLLSHRQCLYPGCEQPVFTYVRLLLAALSILQGVDWIIAMGQGVKADGASVWNEAVYSQWCQHPRIQPLAL